MKRLYFIIPFILFILVPSVQLTGASVDGSSWWNEDYVTTEGTEFWVTFMRNRGSDENDSDLELYLFATSRSNATVTISNPNTQYEKTFTVYAGQRSSRIKIDNLQAYIATPEQVENKGLRITSDYPISLYAINYVQGSQDATYLYPTKGYTNTNYANEFANFTYKEYVIQTFNTDETATEFAIIATEDNTTVDITLKESIFSGDDDYPELPYGDTIITITNLPTFTLDKGQTYLYRASTANASLSGTSICSNENIVVFQGGQHSLIPSYYYTPDNHIWSQAQPTYLWGRNFVITQSGTQKADGVLITAAEDGTNLSIDTIGGVIDTTINKLQTFDFYMRGKPYSVVHASKAIECFLYQTSYSYPETQTYGSPAMIPIMPIGNRFNSIIYATFDFYNPQIKQEDKKHYINIVTLTSGVSSMMMRSSKNGSPLGAATSLSNNFKSIAGTDYSYAIIDVTERGESHVLYNEKEGFVAHAYGFGKTKGSYKESYGYSLGTNLLPSAWMLIDGKRINDTTICLNDYVNLQSVVHYDFISPIHWKIYTHHDNELYNQYNQKNIPNLNFPDTGQYDIQMIVERETPICQTRIIDTIKATIFVKDTFHIFPDEENGNHRIICANERSNTIISGKTYQYRSDTMLVNHTYKFIDSLHTIYGCDSIVYIDVYIAPTYNQTLYDTICVNDLPYSWKDKSDATIKTLNLSSSDKSSLTLTAENAFLTKNINDTKKYETIYGCDSIVNICLTVLPTYQLHQYDTVCVDSINTYSWAKHSMARMYNEDGEHISFITLKQSGEYIYYDSLKTHGCHACQLTQHCDSVWILHLKVKNRYVTETDSRICSNESYLWEDTLWIGWNAETPATEKYKRVFSTDTVLYHAYKTKDIYECDSVIIHRLHICDAYTIVTDTTRVDICEDESYYFASKGETYQWSTPDGGVSRFVLTDTIKTVNSCDGTQHCDSAIAHVVYVHPEYIKEEPISVCQQKGGKYTWTGHTSNPKGLFDKKNGTHVNEIPLDEAGDFEYVDSLITKTCTKCEDGGCDSVWVLKLHINPIFDEVETRSLCENDTIHWRGKVFVGGKAPMAEKAGIPEGKWYWADPKPYTGMPEDEYRTPKTYQTINHLWNGNKYTDSVHYHTINGCDSIYWLELTVTPTYDIHETLTLCDNSSLTWQDTIYAGYKSGLTTSGKTRVIPSGISEIDLSHRYYTQGVYACDSVHYLHLIINKSSHDTVRLDTCEWELPISYTYDGKTYSFSHAVDTVLKTTSKVGTSNCDSVRTLILTVWKNYDNEISESICEGDSIYWDGAWRYGKAVPQTNAEWASYFGGTTHVDEVYENHYKTISGHACDSIERLVLTVHPRKHTHLVEEICDYDTYEFGGKKSIHLPAGHYLDTLHLLTSDGCDSVLTLDLTINKSSYIIEDSLICQFDDFVWTKHEGHNLIDENNQPVTISTLKAGTFVFYDRMKTDYECDSIHQLNLRITPSYYFFDTLTICEDDTVHWQDSVIAGSKYVGDYALPLREILSANNDGYDRYLNYGTTGYGCDSAYYLHLIIHPAYKIVTDTTYVYICDNDKYPFKTANDDSVYNANGEWVSSDKSISHHIITGNDTTIFGCDSAVAHVVHVHPTYRYSQDTAICQDTINTEWIWTDEFGNAHDVHISRQEPGNYHYVDSLKTKTCPDCHEGEGCDSIFEINIHISRIYRFDSTYSICQNERMKWQGRSYVGDSLIPDVGDRVLPIGIHYDTAYYTTISGCDSIYYMQVQVNAVYDTTTYVTICGQEDYVWQQHDIYGTYDDAIWLHHNIDTIYLTAEEALLPQPAKKDTTLYAERMLKTIHECDSMSRLWLTVKPAYLFITDTTICTNDRVAWRGKRYTAKDTIIEERYATLSNGCDSIYQLHLHTKPSYKYDVPRRVCDNDTLFHLNSRYIVWAPGQEIPDPEDCYGIMFTTAEGCDSLYCYHITVLPTYFFDDTIDLCTGESYVFHDTHNILFDTIYDTGLYIPATDTIFKDTLSTIHGCDSVYWLYATVYPTYRHIDEYTICDNDSLIWRDWNYKGIMLDANGLPSGSYTYYDSLLTQNGCDSVYVLKLHVNPTYFYELHEQMCDDESYNFNGQIISGMAGDYFFTDSLLSVSGCDSVYHLYLTIHPSTHEVLYDTLCAGESYDFHEKLLYQDGYYIDTTLNEWGCRHVTELYLTVEDPTSVQVDWVSEICDDEKVMEIHYSYDGRMPISYSVLFDDFGHSQGFVDIIKEPVKEEGIIRIMIPYGEPLPNPRYNPQFLVTSIDTFRYVDTTHLDYPRPGIYPISIYLQNGVCADDRIRVDTIFEMLFPAWIHEQHWNDAIVLFNEKYNGGYHFVNYQWYCDWDSIPGEVQGYLYDPQLLKFGSKYCVKLDYDSIKGMPIQGSAFTCPITPTMMGDTIVPTKPYVAVVPTCVPTGLDGVDILCTEEGIHSYYISTIHGVPLGSGRFTIDNNKKVHHLSLPYTIEGGLLLIKIKTKSGYVRTVKVHKECDLLK